MIREIDKLISNLEQYIKDNVYHNVETERVELKDLSHGDDWNELYKTVNAFLNTKGGIIIIGIKEDTKNKQLKFTDFQRNNEEKIKLITTKFTDENNNNLELFDYINPNLFEIKPFLKGNICVIFVEKLPEDQKYVYYKGFAYERQLTGDHKIPQDKINRQKELKDEFANSTELQLVPNATLSDLDVDKLNDFIIRLNTDKKVETIKADIESAISFLNRKRMIRDYNPTLLGMLVCGNNIFDYVGGRCEVDAYFETGKELADDRKVYTENIIQLMESSWNFTFSKIGIGISTQKGGVSLFEYPEDIIRETINNALAHRDYNSDRFTILRILNNKLIEIRNPGRFREEHILYADIPIKLRRIIPIPKAKNPNLADILKVYKRWEGRGIGMSTLTNYALNNQIDVPYYRLYSENEIGLFIQKGKVFDEESEIWLNSFNKFILTQTNGIELSDEEKTVLTYLYKSEKLNEIELYTVNLTPDNNHFSVINKLIKYGLIEKLTQSTNIIQVYKINTILTKTDYTKELRNLYGGAYDSLSMILKEILQSIHHYNEYSLVSEISANIIGNYLFYKKFGKNEFDLKSYNNFKRNIRNYMNKLESEGFVFNESSKKYNYKINYSYNRKPSLFD